MTLVLSIDEKIARMRGDLRMGVAVVLRADTKRWLIVAAETLHEQRFADLRALGQLELLLTDWRAQTLKTWAASGSIARIEVPQDKDVNWVHSMADPSDDLTNPMRGPFHVVQCAESDFAMAALGVCKKAKLLPAAVAVEIPADAQTGLLELDVAEVVEGLSNSSPLYLVSSAPVPLQVSKQAKVHVFRPDDGGEEHYAIEIGSPDRSAAVLSRLHSACFTGDLVGSLKCDCGPQLDAALAAMGQNGQGVLLYMNQEGRGIGLANKMRAYSLQAQGFDTVDANHRLGFEDDERDFRLGAEILKLLGFSKVRLMTNNPQKTARMAASGIEVVERVPLRVGRTEENADYLRTKAQRSGHIL